MTRDEAYESMRNGNKIYHVYFSDDEFLYMDFKGVIRDEKDYYFNRGWEIRRGGEWETNWYIRE